MEDRVSTVPLAAVAEIIMGQSPKGETYNQIGEGFPLLNGPTEFGESHPVPALWTTSPTRMCNKGDLLFCVRGSTTGRMNWADREYCLGRGVGAFRAKSRQEDTRFIFYTLVNDLPRLLSLCSGSVFPNLSRQDFQNFTINWPDENLRLTIAHILGTLDDKIELNRKMNQTLEAMARAIFKSWFVDFNPVRAKAEGRDPGLPPDIAALFPDSFEDSELGDIPKGWRAGTVQDLANLSRDSVNPLDLNERAWGSSGAEANLDTFLNSKIDVEHILPQSPTKDIVSAFDKPSLIALYIVKIGNLALIEKTLNSSIRNEIFGKKKKAYSQSKFLLTKSLAEKITVGTDTALNRAMKDIDTYEIWNSKSIESRQEMLAKLTQQVWEMPVDIKE